MNNVVEFAGASSFEPKQAVVFYEGKGGGGEFATVHRVLPEGASHRLGPGRPITVEAMKAVATQFAAQLRAKETILREQVLLCNDDLLVWWTPACTRLCFFDIDWHEGQPGRERLQGRSANLPIPPLVWALKRTNGKGIWQGVSVWALEHNARPEDKTPIFRAPLLNLNDNGEVCWGNGSLPARRDQEHIERWQEAFFASVFSHYNHTTPFKGAKAYEVLADMVDNPPATFPVERLIPMGKSLGSVVRNLLGDQHD